MSLKFKLSTVTAMAVAVLAFADIASAQDATAPPTDETKQERGFGKHRGGHRGMRGMGMRGLHGIELTDAQKEQIKAIHEANKPSEAEIAEMKAKREAFRAAREAGTSPTEEQKAQFKAEREARKAKMDLVHQQILAILTPEQKAQLEAKQAERKQLREQRKEMWQKRKAEKPAAAPQTN